jgi:hypothetical protein
VQVDAYHRGVAAILKKIGAGANMCSGHKEYALPAGRKIDPTLDMNEFRQRVSALMRHGGSSDLDSGSGFRRPAYTKTRRPRRLGKTDPNPVAGGC